MWGHGSCISLLQFTSLCSGCMQGCPTGWNSEHLSLPVCKALQSPLQTGACAWCVRCAGSLAQGLAGTERGHSRAAMAGGLCRDTCNGWMDGQSPVG